MDRFEEEQMALAATWSQPNRQTIAAICRERNIALASHDDATPEHVVESHQLGSVIAEFPTTLAAAEASRQHGMNVLMGAPNIVRGGSHSGNVAAHQLAASNLLDILSSDYYPASLLDAAFRIADDDNNAFTLAQAICLVSKNPAQALGLDDRGGLRKVNVPIWCWRTVAANMSILTTSGVKERGSSDERKIDLAGGCLRFRKRQPAGGLTPARKYAIAGGASLYHAPVQRRQRESYCPQQAGVFQPRRAPAVCPELACQ
jgi:alpha-D-ribose 1-methylphosphonate 5-triphosphate diphosphatase